MAGKIHLDHATWTTLVNAANSATGAVPKLSGADAGKMTLTRFTRYQGIQDKVNDVVAQEKAAALTDTSKMLQVGDNVVAYDNTAMKGE
jgi:mevalonate kinase